MDKCLSARCKIRRNQWKYGQVNSLVFLSGRNELAHKWRIERGGANGFGARGIIAQSHGVPGMLSHNEAKCRLPMCILTGILGKVFFNARDVVQEDTCRIRGRLDISKIRRWQGAQGSGSMPGNSAVL